ncbi:hypothetical protein [Rubritalea tangerina]|uniref:hypothetical protein n=1 Tax=Rubritalea tangerina TaxID=430798 RepID=UPI003622B764
MAAPAPSGRNHSIPIGKCNSVASSNGPLAGNKKRAHPTALASLKSEPTSVETCHGNSPANNSMLHSTAGGDSSLTNGISPTPLMTLSASTPSMNSALALDSMKAIISSDTTCIESP